MPETVHKHDFVELEYTGKLQDGTLFDTTNEKIAKEHHLHAENKAFGPVIICVGEQQVLPGLDAHLEGKEIGKEYTIPLTAQEAFGKRDIKKIKIVPMNTFYEHKVQPQPGLQINVDGEMGLVSRVSGGRVIVNFNHPLAGKDVQYIITINRKVTDHKEQISSFLTMSLRIPESKIKVEIADNKATVILPVELPVPFAEAVGKKLAEVTHLQEVNFTHSGKSA